LAKEATNARGKTMFDTEKYLKKHEVHATPQRLKLLRQLAQKPWFQATDTKIRDEIATLPQTGKENHDGFIADLVRRKSEIGGITVRRLLALPRGNFILVPVFEVANKMMDIVYTYEYASFRHGVPAGSKGIVFVRENKKADPTHLIVLSCEKFATAETTFDLIGGLPKEESGQKHEITETIIKEIREETGVQTLQIDEVKILGNLLVEPG
jgi:Fe2+ or Zn2+ uptake regulation protein